MWPEILAENACKGLGKLGKLLLGRYFRQDDYKNILMQAQAEKDALAIANGEQVFDGERLLPAWDLSHMPASSLPHWIGLEEESNNLNATLKITTDILKDTPEEDIADESVDPDWFTRWRREACTVGNPEMQQLWARILAEEIKSPHAISLRTLDILKNITKAEAEIFCKVVRFRLSQIIPSSEKHLPYTLGDLALLQDVGLVSEDFNLVPVTLKSSTNSQVLLCNGFVLSIDFPSVTPLEISGARLSRAGVEILSIADNIPSATLEEINIIGDMVWRTIFKQSAHMTAHISVSQNEFNRHELVRWPH